MVVNSKKNKLSSENDCSILPLSSDGKVLLLLFVIILFGPYLPHFNPLPGRVRLDHLLLPGLGILIFLRSVVKEEIQVSSYFMVYVALLLWFLSITVVITIFPSTKYISPSTSVIAALDSYLRPLLILFIVANMRVGKTELVAVVRLVLLASLPLFIIGILQLVPATKSTVNELLVTLYDNGRATGGSGHKHFYNVLSGGRAMSIFWQVSTFGMFATLCLGLLIAQFIGARIIKSRTVTYLILLLTIIGGVISGSKVFTGGIIIMAISAVISTQVRRHLMRPRNIILAIVTIILFSLMLAQFFPRAYNLFTVRFEPTSFISRYGAGRFWASDIPGLAPKVVRTGAVDIFKSYPVAGLGLTVANRTTDSFLFGILIMGGVIGGFIFILFMGIICSKMLSIARRHPDKTVASLSLAMLFLTIVFFAAAVGFHTFIQDRVGDTYWLLVGLLFSAGSINKEHTKLCHEKIQ